MLVQDPLRRSEPSRTPRISPETRLEARGFVFHGTVPEPGKVGQGHEAGSNVLHFARCTKLEHVTESDNKLWFQTIRVAKSHPTSMSASACNWCKICSADHPSAGLQRSLNLPIAWQIQRY